MGIKQLAAAMVGITLSEESGPLGDYSANVMPPSRATELSPRTALALPAFYRGVSLIAGMGAQLSLGAWRGQEPLINPAPALIRNPDPWRSVRSFIARTLTCLSLHGNAYWRKTIAADGTVLGLEVIDPNTVSIKWRKGVKTYTYTLRGVVYRDRPATEVEHIWFLEVPGLSAGLGPVQACRAALEGITNIREYADNWFDSTDQPSGVLTTDQRLLPEEAAQYKKAWYTRDPEDTTAGPSLRVLGAGLSYAPYFLKPEDAQWLEAQSWGVLDIARLLGLPGDYVLAAVEGSSLTYANLEMIDAQFLRTTLFPLYLAPIEEALSRCLPRGQEARFDASALLRPDAKTRSEIDKTYIDAGVYDGAFVRTREGIPGPAPKTPSTAPATKEAPA